MPRTTRIYGKDGCPYTVAAREDCEKRGVAHEYLDVTKDKRLLDEMLKLSRGRREVPVIVEDDKVTVGFGGT
jgi:glutaredoxin 3